MAGERAGLPKDAPGNEILARFWLCLGMKWSLNGGIQNTNMKQPPQWRAHRRPSARASFDSMPSARAWPLRGLDSGFWRPRINQTLGSVAECPKWLHKNRAFFQHQSGCNPFSWRQNRAQTHCPHLGTYLRRNNGERARGIAKRCAWKQNPC